MTALKSFVTNASETTLSSSLGVGATTLNVVSTTGFPTVPFYVVVDPASDGKREVILVDSSKTGTTLVLTDATKRGQDGTADVTHDAGATVAVVPVAAHINDLHDRIDALGTPYAPGGTDVAIADGGTGASSAAAARTNLGALGTTEHDSRDHSAAMSTVVLDDISNVDLTGIAAGALLYYDGTNIVDLGIGTAGQSLVVNSGATAPEWGAASGKTMIAAGTYVGNGTSQTVALETITTPLLVFAVNETDSVSDGNADGQFSFFVSPLGGGVADTGFLISGSALIGRSFRDLTLEVKGFGVTQNANLSGKTYRYVALGTA